MLEDHQHPSETTEARAFALPSSSQRWLSLYPSQIFSLDENKGLYTGERWFQMSDTFL